MFNAHRAHVIVVVDIEAAGEVAALLALRRGLDILIGYEMVHDKGDFRLVKDALESGGLKFVDSDGRGDIVAEYEVEFGLNQLSGADFRQSGVFRQNLLRHGHSHKNSSLLIHVVKDFLQSDGEVVEQRAMNFRDKFGFFLFRHLLQFVSAIVIVHVAERERAVFEYVLFYVHSLRADNPVFPDTATLVNGFLMPFVASGSTGGENLHDEIRRPLHIEASAFDFVLVADNHKIRNEMVFFRQIEVCAVPERAAGFPQEIISENA